MKVSQAIFLALMTVAVSACDSDDDSSAPPVGPGDMGGNGGGMPGMATLAELAAIPAEGQAVDDGLDQVNADIMTLFGDPDGEPIAINDDDSVNSIINRRRQTQ